MEIIRDHLHDADPDARRVLLRVERLVLAKRRWRGTAEDGREFGFDLDHPLANGDAFCRGDTAVYVIQQKAESVLEIAVGSEPASAARLGWIIGNLHFSLAIEGGVLRVPDDPALRQLFEREGIPFASGEAVFRPLGGGQSHSH